MTTNEETTTTTTNGVEKTSETKSKPSRKASKPNSGKADYGQEGTVAAFAFDPANLVIVDDDPEHPLYDPERAALPVDEALVKSIMVRGVLDPIEFSKNPETNRIEVVDGRQRVKAAREANKRLKKEGLAPITVTGIPKRGRDAIELAGIMAATFIRQEETPMGKARRAQRMLNRGAPEETVLVDLGVSAATLRNYLIVAEMPAYVQKLVESGKLPMTYVYQLKGLQGEELKAKVDELTATRVLGPSGKRAKRGSGQKAEETINKNRKKRSRQSGALTRPGVEVKAMHRRIANCKMAAERKEGALRAIEWCLGAKLEKSLGEISDLSDETDEE